MTKFKNRLSYDAITGKVKDSRNQLSMMEDIWIPRRTDGKTAEIQTLPGSTNTDQTEEVKYFLNKVYSALNVPVSRLNSDTPSGVSFGRTAEITRDELKFSKFIRRLQTQFSNLFYDVLRTQLLLKNIISINDWEDIKNGIKFEFEKDNYYTESKNAAVLKDQLDMMNTIDSMIGKYFSTDFAYKNIMGFNEEEINEEKRLMAVASGKAPEGGDEGAGGDLGFGGDGGPCVCRFYVQVPQSPDALFWRVGGGEYFSGCHVWWCRCWVACVWYTQPHRVAAGACYLFYNHWFAVHTFWRYR
jgi:hypothetical protein